jgi:hypothetical protein
MPNIIKLISFVFPVFLLIPISNYSAIAQIDDPKSAVVIVAKDFLRVGPYRTARSVTTVVKGAKLRVVPSSISKGWYLAYLVEAPSVGGYIYGNSIRFSNESATPRIFDPTVVPKGIILIPVPTTNNSNQNNNSRVNKQSSKRANFCQPPLYCPDIDDVQLSLFDNKDKFEKGKFEKTVEWEKRKESILTKINLSGNKTANERLYFLSDGLFTAGFDELPFNADRERWTFDLEFRETYNSTCLPIISHSLPTQTIDFHF